MTVDNMLEQLQMLKNHGLSGSDIIKAYNGDTEQLEEVTGLLYGGKDHIVEICTDED